jgi:hypothetical protein
MLGVTCVRNHFIFGQLEERTLCPNAIILAYWNGFLSLLLYNWSYYILKKINIILSMRFTILVKFLYNSTICSSLNHKYCFQIKLLEFYHGNIYGSNIFYFNIYHIFPRFTSDGYWCGKFLIIYFENLNLNHIFFFVLN